MAVPRGAVVGADVGSQTVREEEVDPYMMSHGESKGSLQAAISASREAEWCPGVLRGDRTEGLRLVRPEAEWCPRVVRGNRT